MMTEDADTLLPERPPNFILELNGSHFERWLLAFLLAVGLLGEQPVPPIRAADTNGRYVTWSGAAGWYYIYLNAGLTPDGKSYTLRVTYP